MSESTTFCESSKSQRNLTGMRRRRFLTHGAAGLVAGTTVAKAWSAAFAAKEQSDARHGPIKITKVESHHIKPNFHTQLRHGICLDRRSGHPQPRRTISNKIADRFRRDCVTVNG